MVILNNLVVISHLFLSFGSFHGQFKTFVYFSRLIGARFSSLTRHQCLYGGFMSLCDDLSSV